MHRFCDRNGIISNVAERCWDPRGGVTIAVEDKHEFEDLRWVAGCMNYKVIRTRFHSDRGDVVTSHSQKCLWQTGVLRRHVVDVRVTEHPQSCEDMVNNTK